MNPTDKLCEDAQKALKKIQSIHLSAAAKTLKSWMLGNNKDN